MMMDDEKFFAWLDGELEEREAETLAKVVAADPELSRKAEQHRALKLRLGEAFAPVAMAEAPRSNVIDLAEVRARRALPSAAQWAAMAATLVLGMATGTMLTGGSDTPVTTEAGQLMASASLDRALDTQLASAPQAGGPRIGLTYRSASGAICRSFTDGAAQGLACREGDNWRIRGLFQGAEGQSGDFRMAAGPDPALGALIEATIAGEPFDAGAERGARDADWR